MSPRRAAVVPLWLASAGGMWLLAGLLLPRALRGEAAAIVLALLFGGALASFASATVTVTLEVLRGRLVIVPRHPRQDRRGHRYPFRTRSADVFAVLTDVVALARERRAWWIIPPLVALALVGLLSLLESTPAGPLLYPLF